jgi:arylsulfatase A
MKALPLLFSFCLLLNALTALASKEHTNFIIIFTDDQGYQDLGSFGATGFKTPNLDQLAKEGLRFTDFYAASPVCSTSRASLLTGRYPVRNGVSKVLFPRKTDQGMPASEITTAELLKTRGYATAAIGKWHLGHKIESLPNNQGFDYYYGIPYSNDMWLAESLVFAKDVKLNNGVDMAEVMEDKANANTEKRIKSKVPLMRQNEVIEYPADQSALTKKYTEQTIQFIDKNRTQPFFVYLAHTMPHIPLYPSNAFKGRSAKGAYGDVIEEIDWSVGEIVTYLKKHDLDKNTVVIFTSDNGPWDLSNGQGGSALPLNGYKFQTLEGGQRVPAIMWGPGNIVAGKQTSEVVTTLDMLPTLASWAGAKLPSDRVIDGRDLSAFIKGGANTALPTSPFYYLKSSDKAVVEAVRLGEWKYRHAAKKSRKSGPVGPHLYNLKKDISETTNLIKHYPEKANALAKMMQDFESTLNEIKHPTP